MENYKGIDDAITNSANLYSIKGKEIDNLADELMHTFDLNLDHKDSEISYYELANQFLRDEGLILRWYQEDFYEYVVGKYRKTMDSDIKAKIISWCHKNPGLWSKAKKNFREEIFVQLQSICYLGSSLNIPCWIDTGKPVQNFLFFKNGVVNLDDLLTEGEAELHEHDSLIFNLSKLDFNYEPDAEEPLVFLKYLNRVQPNKQIQSLLQEWLGYNLVFDTTLERFMFFIGEGANGKSVFLTLMRMIIGNENVTAVDLEGFKPSNRFALEKTVGKLANIVGDLSEIDKLSEGVLKSFVSGEDIQVERKYKTPFSMKPTARLTYSMNTLPNFYDKSNGIWRRLLLVPWEIIIPLEERDRNLLKESFWLNSGELPGILNWALEGLRRLRSTGEFTLPSSVSKSVAEFKLDSNPIQAFLNENVETSPGSSLSSHTLYASYQNKMTELGLKYISSTQFTREVKRIFKNVNLTDNVIRQSLGIRCRNWIGLKMIE